MRYKHEHINFDRTQGEKKTAFVVIFTAVMMVFEIIFGLCSNSMALLADGIHMGSHVLAIGLSWSAYVFVRRLECQHMKNINKEKVLSLSAYTSGILLMVFAVYIIMEAGKRFFATSVQIHYTEALIVAVIGMIVNIICALVLRDKKNKDDYNRRSAYLHVLADALTSLGVIFGLTCAMIWNIVWIDTVVALVSSALIIRWARRLLLDTGKALTIQSK